jgi:hypothetical protein
MKSGSYHKTPDKTYKKLKSILWGMHFMMMEDDCKKGILKAKISKTLFKAAIVVNINIREIDMNTSQVFVNVNSEKHWLRTPEETLRRIEEQILHSIQ